MVSGAVSELSFLGWYRRNLLLTLIRHGHLLVLKAPFHDLFQDSHLLVRPLSSLLFPLSNIRLSLSLAHIFICALPSHLRCSPFFDECLDSLQKFDLLMIDLGFVPSFRSFSNL